MKGVDKMYMCMYCGAETKGDSICMDCQKALMKISCDKMQKELDEMIKK